MVKFMENLSVILPAYNEEENIARYVITAESLLGELVDNFEIIIINDGSTDNTGAVCKELAEKFDSVRVISKQKNEGYGWALKSGFKAANFELIFFTDSDGQFDLRYLANLLEHVDKYEMVVGFRSKRRDPLKRRFFSYVYNRIIDNLLHLKVKDLNCAFKIFHKSLLDKIDIKSRRYLINTEILSKAILAGASIKEVEVPHFPRHKGESKINLLDIPRTLFELTVLCRELHSK